MPSWNPLNYLPLWNGDSINSLQSQSDAADAKLKELNDQALADGRLTPESYKIAEANRLAGVLDVGQEIYQQAGEGALEGLEKEQKVVRTAINSTASGVLGAFPVWFKVGAVVALLWVGFSYLGGAELLRGILAPKKGVS